jgi:2-polyprenyl-3-methyl-5-hydroxy-6-metoxy-1,4-benzoquinol methylase
MNQIQCRFCKNNLYFEFIDLVNSPPSNSFLTKDQLNEPEIFYPLKIFVCNNCYLVQINEFKKSEEIFNKDYAYFSSYSKSWLEHSKNYSEKIITELKLNVNSFVIEIASNDGYFLQYIKKNNIPCLGIEPTHNTANAARDKGIKTLEIFFGEKTAKEIRLQYGKPDLIVANNVLAHVPDILTFVNGIKILLKESGTATLEFPHLMRLVELSQFDTIYHEHFSYLSLMTVKKIFKHCGLEIYDVEEIPTHGGSLRIYVKHFENQGTEISRNVKQLLQREIDNGMEDIGYYQNFQTKADKIKYDLLKFLLNEKARGKKVIAYGAAAKGNTLLNYCGVKKDLIEYVVDASPFKQGNFLPGSHIPIVNENEILDSKPDYIILLPWNIKDEIMEQLKYVRKWNGQFVIPIPKLQVI